MIRYLSQILWKAFKTNENLVSLYGPQMTRHQSVFKNNPNPWPLDFEVHLQMPYDTFGGKKMV
jgi:hypothetical protein